MFITKVLLTGFIGFSLCNANINGIVTDSSGRPITGAVVRLEKAGLADTTKSNGLFILSTTSVNIIREITQILPHNFSATIHNEWLCINVAKKSAVEIAAFDIIGKTLSRVQKTMDIGTHSIALPRIGAGVYIYKVKSANSEILLKSNSLDDLSQGKVISPQSSFPYNSFAKQIEVASGISDVIAVTKNGYLNYRIVVNKSDTSGIEIKMIVCAGTVTDTEGNIYQTAKIGNQVWMTENLRTTHFNDGTTIPLVTDSNTWAKLGTPACCWNNNDSETYSKKMGALYNGYVVDTKKLAPAGWHVPDTTEWISLMNYLVTIGQNWDGTTSGNKIAKSLAAKTDWVSCPTPGAVGDDLTKNNSSGFSALPGGFRSNGGFSKDSSACCYWWNSTEIYGSSLYYSGLFSKFDFFIFHAFIPKTSGCLVRLIKN